MSSVVDIGHGDGSMRQLIDKKKEKHIYRLKNSPQHRQYTDYVRICTIVMTLISVAGVIVTSVIMYSIQRQHIANLTEEMRDMRSSMLEMRSSMLNMKDRIAELETQKMNPQSNIQANDKQRMKRCVNPPLTGSSGFPNSSIAMFYASTDELQRATSPDYHDHDLVFTDKTSDPLISSIPRCRKVWENKKAAIWCQPNFASENDRFMLGSPGTFPYFSKGSWMNTDESRQVYNLRDEGRVQIQSNGLYLIFANVFFTHETSLSFGYKVRMNRGREKTELGHCIRTAPNDTNRVYGTSPCPVIFVAALRANDIVSLDIQPFIFVKFSKENLNFGLVKLTDNY